MKAYYCITDFKALNSAKLFDTYGSFFEESRLERIKSTKNELRKAELIATGALLYRGLERFGAEGIEILHEKNGKPYLKDRTDLFFNLSNSGDKLLMAVAEGKIGADLQKAVPFKEALFERITSEEEREALTAYRGRDFNRLWALKEAYVKLTGDGIGKAFSDISFQRSEGCFKIYDNNILSAFGLEIYKDENYAAVLTMGENFTAEEFFIKL